MIFIVVNRGLKIDLENKKNIFYFPYGLRNVLDVFRACKQACECVKEGSTRCLSLVFEA